MHPGARSQEVIRPTLVANDQTPEIAGAGEESLYLPAPLVAPQVAPVLDLRFLAPPPVRSNHLYALRSELRVERVGIVGPIPD
jgi:hypothetical protein